MPQIRVSDRTIARSGKGEYELSFREKLECAKLLDRLGTAVIELAPVERLQVDSLLIKSVATAVEHAAVAVPVSLEGEDLPVVCAALAQAVSPRLQIAAPVSTVQMEYLFHKKPDAMLAAVEKRIRECRAAGFPVEFVAEDALRAEPEFLLRILTAAVEAGADPVTVEDSAGTVLPEEMGKLVEELLAAVPGLRGSSLGVSCSNRICMADACSVAALVRGAVEVKVSAYPSGGASLNGVASVLRERGPSLGFACGLHDTEIGRILSQIDGMCAGSGSARTPFESGVREENESLALTAADGQEAVLRETERLGYELTQEDREKVWESFLGIAEKKGSVTLRELDAIVASSALQVPPTYVIDHYIITASNIVTSTAHIKLRKNGEMRESVCVGDGPVDASFLAIEQIVGEHYELDDFQIRAVTEGHEAMGEAVVKLRGNGRVYSGRGISTDIIASSILAYINALNKIAYEEDPA